MTLVQGVASVLGGFLGLATPATFGFGLLALGSGAAASNSGSEFGGAVGGLVGVLGGLLLGLGLFYGALATFWFRAAQALPRGRRGARIAVSVVCGLHALPVMLNVLAAPGLLLIVLLVLGAIAGALWLPADARRHFGEASLPMVEGWQRSAVAFGATVAAHAPTVTPPGAAPSPCRARRDGSGRIDSSP